MITSSEKETRVFAKSFAKKLKGGEVLILTGDLGGGKTTFTRGLAEGLGLEGAVTSPTFVILQIYKPKPRSKKKLALYHFDLYRIKTTNELFNLGFEDFLNDKNAVIVLEWGEKFLNTLPPKTKQIFFKNLGEEKREIKVA
jgi:tRNA threonylcarbamoyladenosine biosynthesis protein TsaE